MKLLEKERVDLAAPNRGSVAPRSIATPSIRVRARIVASPAPLARTRTGIGGRVVLFASLTALVYVSSTLGGYVMLERARQQGRHSEARAAYARREASAARESIEALTNPAALRAWADSHGFVVDVNKPAAPSASGDRRVAFR